MIDQESFSSLRDELIAVGLLVPHEVPPRTYHTGPKLLLDGWAWKAAQAAIEGYKANGPTWDESFDNVNVRQEIPSEAAE